MRVGIMWKYTLLLVSLSGCCLAGPLNGVKRNVPIVLREEETDLERPAPEPIAPEYPDVPVTLTLPSNATSIRTDITDNFSCDDRVYGYYADVDNDCQIFHVCLPVTYADGKENTFRWSFICPEETLFSQDSFTCMRREDMSITCEDSVNYYELNRNFGMTEQQNANTNNAQTNEEPVAADTAEPAQQETEEPAAAPAPQPPKPLKEKPVKVQKPNRRKPQPKPQQATAIHPTNKLPSFTPLRKMPNVVPSVPVPVPAEVVSVADVKDEVKPVPPRYKKRPAVFNTEKEVVEKPSQPFKVEFVHSESNPESFKRKRPNFAHKNNVVVTKVAEEVPVVEAAPEVVEAVEVVEPVMPSVKFESNLATATMPAKEENVLSNEAVAQIAEETPVVIVPVQFEEDAVPQASETGVVVVKPGSALKTIEAAPAKDAVVEPNELVVPVAEEDVDNVAPIVEEAVQFEEPAAEDVLKIDEPLLTEAEPAVVEQAAQTEKEAEPAATPAEAIEDTPAVISQAQENAAEEEKLPVPDNQEINVETPAALPEEALSELADQLAGASEPVALETAPAVIVPFENTEESLAALPSLEELEEQKPADAVETMPATPEMEQQDPIVQQAFEDTDAHLQTFGGFKPVDPELAAEAESLISDFINTLKSGHHNVKPILPMTVEEAAPAASTENEETKVENETLEQTENKTKEEDETKAEEAPAAIEAEINSLKTVDAEETVPVVVENEPTVSQNVPAVEEEVKISPLLKFPISNSFPADMYHIPVTIIQTPYEEIQNAETDLQVAQQENNVEAVKAEEPLAQTEAEAPVQAEKQEEIKLLPAESTADSTDEQKVEIMPALDAQPEAAQAEVAAETQPEAPQPAASEQLEVQPAAPIVYRPISIDDIVELVKERLDQTPANEKGTPMELVMEPGNADKPIELKFSLEKGSAPQEEPVKQTPAEDIIFPIYHRLSEAESNDLKTQETVAVEEPSALVADLKKFPAEEELAAPNIVESLAQPVDQTVETEAEELDANVAKTTTYAKTETKLEADAELEQAAEEADAAVVVPADTPVETETAAVDASAKANRAFRSRSLTKAKLDPRKRRFLFRADAS